VSTLLAACVITPLGAQETSGRGFLFGAPSATVTLRAGYDAARAGSDVFSFVTNELTLNRGDFGAFAVGGDLAVAVAPRVSVVLSVDNAGMTKPSEFREWQDNSGNPIAQSTSFSRTTFMASVRYYVLPPGRSLGRLAWVPARYAPWVSLGVGRTSYTLSQSGDFIDFDKGNSVFTDSFRSSQWGTTAQAAAGLDWTLNQRFALTTQASYLWGKAKLQYDFSGFDPIDLSGVGVTAGLTVRF
jgi:hypothetical protein